MAKHISYRNTKEITRIFFYQVPFIKSAELKQMQKNSIMNDACGSLHFLLCKYLGFCPVKQNILVVKYKVQFKLHYQCHFDAERSLLPQRIMLQKKLSLSETLFPDFWCTFSFCVQICDKL